MSELVPSELKVADLRKELTARNLSAAGLKKDLVKRLEDALSISAEGENNKADMAAEENDQIELMPAGEEEEAPTEPAVDEPMATDEKEEDISRKRSLGEDLDEDLDTHMDTTDNGIATTVMDSIYIKNLERPLTTHRLTEFLEEHGGKAKDVWLNSIKTRGYVTLESSEQAATVLEKINGVKFPPEHGNNLECGSITSQRMKELIAREDELTQSVRTTVLKAAEVSGGNCGVELVDTQASRDRSQKNKKQRTDEVNGNGEGKRASVVDASAAAAAASAAASDAQMTARGDGQQDTGTKTTKFEPSITYRPLTDQEVAAKKAAAASSRA